MASARASKTAGPGTCSTTSSHQRSGSSYPAAAASSPTGSVRARGVSRSAIASWCAAGRSQNRTGTPAPSAYPIACHSGENTANGQNAAFCGSPGTYPSSATGGRISSSAASATSPSASGGPSISTTSGRCSARAARTDRADPGP